MKSSLALLCVISLLGIIACDILVFADNSIGTIDTPTKIEELEERIDSLDARIEQLESQISGVQQAGGVAPPSFSPPLPNPLTNFPQEPVDGVRQETIPRSAIRGEINGVPFYTLPLSSPQSGKESPVESNNH